MEYGLLSKLSQIQSEIDKIDNEMTTTCFSYEEKQEFKRKLQLLVELRNRVKIDYIKGEMGIIQKDDPMLENFKPLDEVKK